MIIPSKVVIIEQLLNKNQRTESYIELNRWIRPTSWEGTLS